YRDVRECGTLDHLRIFKDTDAYRLKIQADHIGYRDQWLFGSVNRYGKLKASFEWNQMALFYSADTRPLYDRSSPGTLTLPDALQSGIQNRTTTLAGALSGAAAFDLRTRRDLAHANPLHMAPAHSPARL